MRGAAGPSVLVGFCWAVGAALGNLLGQALAAGWAWLWNARYIERTVVQVGYDY